MSRRRVEDIDPHDRRRFFLEGLGRAIGPVADYLEEKLPVPTPRTLLRPPGALAEDAFLETCYRCGGCIEACPAGAIRQHQSDADLAGTPYIDPDIAPCVLCDDRACVNACPSGALRKVRTNDIDMGRADVHRNICLLPKGQACGLCVEKCPIGEDAIRINEYQQIEVLATGCIGCGVCQHQCPTVPKAIIVTPSP